MIDFTKILDNFFSEKQLNVLNNFSSNKDINIDELRKTGDVEDFIESSNGITVRTIKYNSFDGNHSFYKTITYNSPSQHEEKIKLLDDKIKEAVKEEDYELAAKLKKEKINLLQTTRK